MAKKQGLNISGKIRQLYAQREAQAISTTVANRSTDLTNNNAPTVVGTDVTSTTAGTVTDGESASRRKRVAGGLSSQLGINA